MSDQYLKLAGYRLETFEKLVGDQFVFDNQFRLKLVEACAFGSPKEARTATTKFRPPFSLLFESCHAEVLSTGTHEVWHDALEQFSLSINPVPTPPDRSGDCDSLYYESIFA